MGLQAAVRCHRGRRQKTALLLLAFLVSVGLAAWWTLERIEQLYRHSLQDTLEAMVSVSQEGFLLWAEDKKANVFSWAQSEPLRQAVLPQLEASRAGKSLKSNPAANEIRQLLLPVVQRHGYSGYAVVALDGTTLASDLDEAVGTKTILLHAPTLIEGALRGEPQIDAPDRALSAQAIAGAQQLEQQALLVAAPIRAGEGSVIAALVFQVAPERYFARVAHLGRFGRTGETYVFNPRGQMVTHSRFEAPNQSIELRDPGAGLTRGGTPSRPTSQQPLTLMAASALAGSSGSNLTGYNDYRGVRVVGAWSWNDELGLGLATEIDFAEAFRPLKRTQALVLALLMVAVTGALGLAWTLDSRARALHESLTQRDDFLSLASHELKTPLTVLQLHTQRLVATVTGTGRVLSREKQVDLATTLIRHVRKLNKLLESMFEVAQFRAEGLALNREPVDLSRVVQSALHQLRPELAARGAAMTVVAPESIAGMWDRARLEQVVMHLLSNALKFGEGKPVEISLERTDGIVRLCVQDHGIGIAPEAQLLIFEQYGHAVSSRHYGGLGLSLCRVRQIVEAHGGQLQVQSAPGAGARFIVEIPVHPRSAWRRLQRRRPSRASRWPLPKRASLSARFSGSGRTQDVPPEPEGLPHKKRAARSRPWRSVQ
jgi:signal transduction histidine kinase